MKSRLLLIALFLTALAAHAETWRADNGNGTYTNPLFYDEFSDPDLIRVGDDYYLTGTTNHCMPSLPILHSQDLVNWELLGYALDRLDLGPEYRLEGGKDIYGQGIWAPSFRYHDGTFYIFSNVNGRKTQLFTAKNPAGPWTHSQMKRSLHDLSVLFDDDGKVYVVWGYQDMHLAQLTPDLTDLVPGTERVLFAKDAGMGEGAHFYKVKGKYYITSAWYAVRMRMACARADKPEGPYEVNKEISADEDFGLSEGYRLGKRQTAPNPDVVPPNPAPRGHMSLHQGGIVETTAGETWGFSMMDYNSLGRVTCLSPITWKDGWPYFGLPGNLEHTPRTWVKPATTKTSPPGAPYERSDDFAGPKLKAVWQWNHVPDDAQWSLAERPGFLRLHALRESDLLRARNTLTQRAMGPISTPTAELDVSGMKPGDAAGLGLLTFPHAWIGVSREGDQSFIEQRDQATGKSARQPLEGSRVFLRAQCDFLTEKAAFSYSLDGKSFQRLGEEFTMIYQLRTFQGVRYSLFNYHTGDGAGGYADFNGMRIDEPFPHGLTKPIPFEQTLTLTTVDDRHLLAAVDGALNGMAASDARAGGPVTRFKVIDRGTGRVALQAAGGFVSVAAPGKAGQVTLKAIDEPGEAETFQWTETPYGDLTLLSIASQRSLCLEPGSGAVSADHSVPRPDRKDGSCFRWSEIARVP